jgi:hypothetical protein
MADTTKNILIRVKSETEDANKDFKSLQHELKEIQKAMNLLSQAGKEGSKDFELLSQRAGELKDQIGDTKARINALASDTFKLDAMTGAVEGLASGFAVVEGATALFGSENEDLQKTLVRVQGAMALLQGAQSIQNLLQKESAVYIGVTTLAQKTYNAVVGDSVGVTKAFRIALATTGVGVLVGVIGYLASNWESLTNAISGSNRELGITKETLTSVADQYADEQVSVRMLVHEYENVNTSASRKKEILQELNKISPNYFSTAIKNTNDLKRAQDLFNQSLLAQVGFEAVKSTMIEKQKKFFQDNGEAMQRLNEIQNEMNLLQKEADKEERGKASGRIAVLRMEKEQLEVNLYAAKGIFQTEQDNLLKYAETFKVQMDKLGGPAIEEKSPVQKLAKQTKKVVRQTFDDLDMLTLKSVGTIAQKMTRTLDDFSWFYEQQRALLDTFMDDNSHSFDQMQMQLDTALANRVISITEYNERVAKLNQLEYESKVETGKAIANVLQAMSDAVGKQTKAGKIMATASALINTYLGISEVLKAKNPYPEPFGTAIKIANASVIGINGFKQVREINKVQIPNQSGGGGNTGSQPSLAGASSGSMPNVQSIGSQLSSATKIQLNQFENFKNPTIRAYVVESDVTGTQQRAKRLKQTSTIK